MRDSRSRESSGKRGGVCLFAVSPVFRLYLDCSSELLLGGGWGEIFWVLAALGSQKDLRSYYSEPKALASVH